MSESKISAAIDNRIDAANSPFNARTVERKVADPYNTGRMVVATASTRDDTLGRLYSRGQVKEHQFAAGRHLQAAFDALESNLKAFDPSKDVVSGGRGSVSERAAKAANEIAAAEKTLGKRAFQLVRDVLLIGYGIEEAAAARGYKTARSVKYLGSSFRDALDDLADLFGYRVKGSSKPRPVNGYRA